MKTKQKQALRVLVLVVIVGVAWALEELGVVEFTRTDGQEGVSIVDRDGRVGPVVDSTGDAAGGGMDRLVRAIRDQESGVITEAKGVVVKILPDDNEGDRHQRFIIKLPSGQTVLVAHNIDLARRVPIDDMDIVEIKGQFEWNDRGGVMHWTHHDPGGRHEDGWIMHEGEIYQ